MEKLKSISELLLPAVTGSFMNWSYFNVIFKVRNLVEHISDSKGNRNYRVKTVDEVNEIYSKRGVSKMLQRVYDEKRLKPITEYFLNQSDSYVNNFTFGIYGGKPDWFGLDIRSVEINNDISSSDKLEEIEDSIGIIKLSGDEILFVLDGQHRIKGLREAVKSNESLLDQQVSATIIVHNPTEEGRIRTRRLFTTVNRYAKPVSEGENILLDEDDLSAIIVRKLIEEYPPFIDRQVIELSKSTELRNTNRQHLTTVIALWNVCEQIIDNETVYPVKIRKKFVRVRPDDDVIDKWKDIIFQFWNSFLQTFEDAKLFVDTIEKDRVSIVPDRFERFYFRPIGQKLLALVFRKLLEKDKVSEFNNLSNLEKNLSSDFWNHILWDTNKGKIISTVPQVLQNYMLYHLGYPLEQSGLRNLRTKYFDRSNQELGEPKYLQLINWEQKI